MNLEQHQLLNKINLVGDGQYTLGGIKLKFSARLYYNQIYNNVGYWRDPQQQVEYQTAIIN